MHLLDTTLLECPYCGEQIEMVVDCSIEEQKYIEDCSVCCRPMVIEAVTVDGEIKSIEARSEDQ